MTTRSATPLSLASDKTLLRIAFGSCAFQWADQPIWPVIARHKPDVFLFLGDAIYGDFDGKKPFTPTAETLRRDWGLLASKPEFRAFRDRVPIMATWDNHDYLSRTMRKLSVLYICNLQRLGQQTKHNWLWQKHRTIQQKLMSSTAQVRRTQGLSC